MVSTIIFSYLMILYNLFLKRLLYRRKDYTYYHRWYKKKEPPFQGQEKCKHNINAKKIYAKNFEYFFPRVSDILNAHFIQNIINSCYKRNKINGRFNKLTCNRFLGLIWKVTHLSVWSIFVKYLLPICVSAYLFLFHVD